MVLDQFLASLSSANRSCVKTAFSSSNVFMPSSFGSRGRNKPYKSTALCFFPSKKTPSLPEHDDKNQEATHLPAYQDTVTLLLDQWPHGRARSYRLLRPVASEPGVHVLASSLPQEQVQRTHQHHAQTDLLPEHALAS